MPDQYDHSGFSHVGGGGGGGCGDGSREVLDRQVGRSEKVISSDSVRVDRYGMEGWKGKESFLNVRDTTGRQKMKNKAE